MFSLFGIGFTAPWLLAALAGLPILWILLRAVPPAPKRLIFPAVSLLLGLRDDQPETQRTPWWLLALRSLAIAALILGFAGPVLNPQETVDRTGPLLIVTDASWASAADWDARSDRIAAELEEAARTGRTTAVIRLTEPPPPGSPVPFAAASEWQSRLPGLLPAPWEPGAEARAWAAALTGSFDTLWLTDGLDRDRAPLLAAFEARGPVSVVGTPAPLYALRPAEFLDGKVRLTAIRADSVGDAELTLAAHGPDPAGISRVLAQAPVRFASGEKEAQLDLVVPPELRNRFTRFTIEARRSAGAVALADDSLRRREVALYSGREDREGLLLLSPSHFLRQALSPTADLLDGALADILPANPDVIILADVAVLSEAEASGIRDWVEQGGLLVRFAGPRLAASDIARQDDDPLLPVRLRVGGRSIGGAMSWGDPRSLRAFAPNSPFYGLTIPNDVQISAQVLAQPDPDLPSHTIAALDDGTPLVTRKQLGQGQVVLFHVTANAEWSSLPLSGLFVQMLERLAVSTRSARPDAADMAGTTWIAQSLIDGFGETVPSPQVYSLPGETLINASASRATPPGTWASEKRVLALNVIAADRELIPATWPARITVQGLETVRPEQLKGYALAAALALLAVDILATLWISGRLTGPRGLAAASLVTFALMASAPEPSQAQTAEDFALQATTHTVLAYVRTGDAQVDAVSRAGLTGLSDALFARTSVEPSDPIGVDLERDELAFFPLLYWPVTPGQDLPSDAAYARLNRYLRGGGMILFDTRDANTAGLGAASMNSEKLRALALPLDIPPLETVPVDHILTRTFYLLQDFPGRYAGGPVWVEAAPPGAEQAEGMPFRNLNDNVTPVVIGGNDWAAAWAIDGAGNWMYPVGRGLTGERQREYAIRFGVNLVMHVLTGNYKSDQVHVPALLERLGQ